MEEEREKMMNLRGRERRKRSSVGIVCCFTGQHHRRASLDASSNVSPLRSPSSWFKSCRSNDSPGKCRNFMSRMARHRRHSSADFSYDPLSYALNFEDEAASPADHDQFRALSFNTRLQSLPRKTGYSSNHDHNLPRSPMTARGSEDLRRGFEALSASMMKPTHQRSNNTNQQQPTDQEDAWQNNSQELIS